MNHCQVSRSCHGGRNFRCQERNVWDRRLKSVSEEPEDMRGWFTSAASQNVVEADRLAVVSLNS